MRTLLDTFMEDSLGLKRTDTGVAQRFLQSQIKDYEQKLIEAEERLAAFKQQNVGLMPGSGGDYYQRLETEMGTLQQMQQVYSQLQNRRNELERQLQGEEPTYGLMGSAEGSPIDGQIARFKAQRDQLLLQYTEKHPQVQSLNETIARLEEEKKRARKVSSSVAPPGADLSGDQAMVRSLDMNPVYQNLRLSLSQADADLAEMRGQMAAQQAVIADLRSRVNAIPEVEAELSRLNRDYEVNKRSTTRCCSASSRRRSRSRPSRAPRTSSSASSSRRPCRSSRAARSRPCSIRWCCSRRSGPGSASRSCSRSCTRPSRRATCCRRSPACRCSAPSRRPCGAASCPGTGARR